MSGHNPTVKKTGFLWWSKTVVEHATGTSEFRGNAKVTETSGSLCVAETGLFADRSVCFLKSQTGGQSGLPDGELTGRSKSVELVLSNGQVKTFQSSIFGLHSAAKEGDQIVIRKAGLFGESEVERIPAAEVSAVKADHCKVCEAVNPLFQKE